MRLLQNIKYFTKSVPYNFIKEAILASKDIFTAFMYYVIFIIFRNPIILLIFGTCQLDIQNQ